jgi:hypothetical protein
MIYDKGDYTIIPNKNSIKGQKSYIQAVYFWIVEHSNVNLECFPSRKLLAIEAGCSLKNVDMAIKKLVVLGILIKINRKHDNSKELSTNLYRVVLKTSIPSSKNAPTPSSKNDLENSTHINSIHLTTYLVENKQKILKQIQRNLNKYDIDDDPEDTFNIVLDLAKELSEEDYKQTLKMYGICINMSQLMKV